MRHIYTSVDIGSDTIKIVVCELFNNKLNLLAASSIKSKGIKKGLITDVEEARESVKKGLFELEEMLGITIKKVIASVPSYNAEYQMIKGQIDLGGEKQITGADISKLLNSAINSKEIDNNKEIITIIPVDFALDNKEGIKDPKGMTGSILSTRAVMVLTPKKNIYSVVSLLENIGLEVIDISLNNIGDVNAIREKYVKEQVGAIINIGYETTTISLCNKGIIVKSSTLGIGGKNVDNDIAYIYKLKPEDSTKVKEKFALAHTRYASSSDIYEIEDKIGESIKIKQQEISEVVMSRIEEILVLARKEINTLTKREVDYILITGGTSGISNFSLIAEEVLGKVTKIGNIKIVGLRNNKYSSAVGNIIYFINKLKLKGKNYTMLSDEDLEELSSTKKNVINVSNESMLGKVFGYFFSE